MLALAWPSGVPATLWTYRLLQPKSLPLLPFSGVSFEPAFLYAFSFGALFIMVFAWQRFRLRSYDVSAAHYRVLTELEPVELRGPTAMNRAYLIYVGILLAIYVLMTFFGKAILQTVGQLPIAGIQVDASELNFNSPQWPLLLAFGFAGFAPMIKPLEISETWLRRRAHQAVGIPVKVRENTQRLLNNLQKTTHLQSDHSIVPPWVPVYLGRWEPIDRVLLIHGELENLVGWVENDTNLWPTPWVRERLIAFEASVIDETKAVLQEFDELMRESYNEAPPQPAPAAPPKGSRAKPANQPQAAPDEALRLHQKRMELRLSDILKRMVDLRDQLVALLAVYGERDANFGKISNATLQELMRRSLTANRLRGGPEFGILACLVPAFVVYALACAFGLHPLLSYTVDKAPLTVLVTAGLETFRLASLLLFPVMAAFAVRQTLLDRGEWAAPEGSAERLARQRMAAIALGWITATVFLFILAAIWAFCVGQNLTHMRGLLFGPPVPFSVFYVTQSGLVVFYLLFALLAADTNPAGKPITRGVLGAMSALCVVGWLAGHAYYWFSGQSCSGGPFLADLFSSKGCFKNYAGLDFLIYPLIAFLSASIFGARPVDAEAIQWPGRRRWSWGAAATAAVVLIVLALVWGHAVRAQEAGASADGSGVASQLAGEKVRVGFRADAEPFSYKVALEDETAKNRHAHYIGFIADLCYKIFDGSKYQIETSEVTAENRFKLLEDGKIDVLCDPVTLRYSGDDPLRGEVGNLSPIVFATGVSYMSRRTKSQHVPTYLGFVDGSTAEDVVQQACKIDMLRVRPNDQDCKIATATEGCQPAAGEGKPGQRSTISYWFCKLPSHDKLIEWFCRATPGDAVEYRRVYFGDRDLILGKLRTWRERGNSCPESDIEYGVGSLTYEPYALIVTKRKPDLVQHVQRRVYEFFSHRAEATSLFTTYFRDQQMSDALAYLFLLNGVEEENRFFVPDGG